MDEIQSLMHGFAVAMTWNNLIFMFIGVLLGVIIGVLPGLGGANGVAILLPLTFSMAQTPEGQTTAIILLSCIYWGALFGGAITSILFNIPGEPWSVATTFDGYPLAQQGRPGTALTAAFTSSFIGALIAVLVVTFLAPVVAHGELDAKIAAWADARRGAKLLVATQTNVIEAAVDERGDCVPLTPVIEVRPAEQSLWLVAAVLTNPVTTAIACRLGAGSATISSTEVPTNTYCRRAAASSGLSAVQRIGSVWATKPLNIPSSSTAIAPIVYRHVTDIVGLPGFSFAPTRPAVSPVRE